MSTTDSVLERVRRVDSIRDMGTQEQSPIRGRFTATTQNPPVANTTTAPAVIMSVVSQPMVVASLPFR